MNEILNNITYVLIGMYLGMQLSSFINKRDSVERKGWK